MVTRRKGMFDGEGSRPKEGSTPLKGAPASPIRAIAKSLDILANGLGPELIPSLPAHTDGPSDAPKILAKPLIDSVKTLKEDEMRVEKTVAHGPYRCIPSRVELTTMVQPSTSMRAVLVRTTAFAGLRASEQCTLSWDDLDLGFKIITVRSMSGRSPRVIPLPPMLAQALREWRAVVPFSPMNLVFPNQSRGTFSPKGLAIWYRRGGGLYSSYPLMSLRAFFIAWCMAGPPDGKGGLTQVQLARLLGKAILWDRMRSILEFGPEPIDLKRYAAAERAVFSSEKACREGPVPSRDQDN